MGVTGIMPLITHRVDGTLMDRLPDLKVIANYGAGVDNIDVAEATRRGIQVTNTPGVLSESTADLTFALMLAACRRLVESDAVMRAQAFPGWAPDYQLGIDVYGKTLGIVGLGKIGQAVARRARGFDMPLLYTQRTRLSAEQEAALGVQYASLDELIAQSDILSLHAPLTPETRHLINRDTLARMKPGSVLINTARGPLVDEAALAEALVKGPLFAAGLDVFEAEPAVHPALIPLKNVVLAAHIGSATQATRQRMGDTAIRNLLAVLAGRPPLNPVNTLSGPDSSTLQAANPH
jgi:glyoxylate reductase